MVKHVDRVLQEFFNGKKGKRTLGNLYKALNAQNGDAAINALFFYVNRKVENYKPSSSTNDIFTALEYVESIINESINIDRRQLKRKIKKTIENCDRTKLEKRNKVSLHEIEGIIKKLNRISKRLVKLNETVENKDTGIYSFFMCIIDNTRNLGYIEQTLEVFPNCANATDSEGNTIFYNLIKKTVKLLNSNQNKKDDINYYLRVLETIKSHPSFQMEEKDKINSLKYLNNCIKMIKENDKKMRVKLEYLNNMANTLLNEKQSKSDITELLKKHHIDIEFSSELKKQLNICLKNNTKDKINQTLKDNYIITIDDDATCEIDDGLSIKRMKNGNYLLGIHISDPLSYIPYDSKIITEAIKRTCSIYIPDNKIKIYNTMMFNNIIPMFPESFSVNKASLQEGNKVYANSYFYELDKDANIVDKYYMKSIVKSAKRCSYKEVNNIINEGYDNERVFNTVMLLDELVYKLEEKNNGEKIYRDIKERNFNPSNIKTNNSRAGKIISTLMTFNGAKVGEYFADNNFPTLYRVHSIDNLDVKNLEEEIGKISTIHNKKKYEQVYQILLSTYPKAKYDIEGSHDGLGLEHYCHCTSPLRRAADLVVSHSLDKCYFSKCSDKELYELENSVKKARDIINAKNDDIEQFLLEFERKKIKRKMTKV